MLGVQPNQELNALIITDETYRKNRAEAKAAGSILRTGKASDEKQEKIHKFVDMDELDDVEMKQEIVEPKQKPV